MEWIPSSKGLVSGLHKVWGPFLAWNKAAVGLSKEANGNKNLCNSIKLKVWTLKGGQNPKRSSSSSRIQVWMKDEAKKSLLGNCDFCTLHCMLLLRLFKVLLKLITKAIAFTLHILFTLCPFVFCFFGENPFFLVIHWYCHLHCCLLHIQIIRAKWGWGWLVFPSLILCRIN